MGKELTYYDVASGSKILVFITNNNSQMAAVHKNISKLRTENGHMLSDVCFK